METGEYPSHFKMVEVVSIFKSNNKNQATNYRPVSLISNFTKILDKLLHKHLMNY